MTNKREKEECPYCFPKKFIRRVGKHINHFHLGEVGYRDGFDDHRRFKVEWKDKTAYVAGYEQGHLDS